MRRLAAFLALPVCAVVACETPAPTASPGEVSLAAYAAPDIELKGIDYSAITPPEMQGYECQWIIDGDALVTAWSRPDCEEHQGITMWVEYTARLTPGIWRIGLNVINTGAGLGDDPTWYPEFRVRSSLGPTIMRIPASDTEVYSGYVEHRVTSQGDFTVRFWWLNDKSDFSQEPWRDANIKIVSVFFDKVPGRGARPMHWTVLDLPCPEGTDPIEDGQLQSVQPLDPASGLVIIGTSTVCQGGAEEPYWTPDWWVWDLSSGSAVLVDAFDTEGGGYNIGVHSPVNAPVAFGVEGAALTIYDDGFSKMDLPDGVWGIDVWAASARSVWIAGSTDPWDTYDPWATGGAGKIVRFDGQDFAVEHDGGSPVLDIWGFGSIAMFASTMTGILQRNQDGTWTEAELPETCGGTYAGDVLDGLSPRDVWVARYTCLLHFDGRAWSTVPAPERLAGGVPTPVWVQAVLPLGANALLVAGQGGQLVPAGGEFIALWGTVDGGQTWRQFSDPVFAGLPGPSYRSFFAMGATQGVQRILLPTILGRRLFVGTPMDFAAISQLRANHRSAGTAAHEAVKP